MDKDHRGEGRDGMGAHMLQAREGSVRPGPVQGHRRVVSRALRARTVPRTSLCAARRQKMLELMQCCYDGVEPARFFADLEAKHVVILLYNHGTQELVGFSTMRVEEEQVQGQRVELIFSGDTVIHPDYWGQKALQAAFGRFILSRKLRHPFRPCLWLLLSKGVKTYLLMVNHFPQSFPQPGKTMPPAYKMLCDRLARTWWPDAYDAARGVLHFVPQRDCVKPHLGTLDVNPDTQILPQVAFFLAQNPGYSRGDEFVCLAKLRVVDLLRALIRIAWRKGRLLVRGG